MFEEEREAYDGGQLGGQCHGKSTGFTIGKSMFDISVVMGKLSETCFFHSQTWETVIATLQGCYEDEMR